RDHRQEHPDRAHRDHSADELRRLHRLQRRGRPTAARGAAEQRHADLVARVLHLDAMPVRNSMRTLLSMLVLGTALVATSAHATPTFGTVDSVRPPQITVSGRSYTIEAETELLDRGGHRIQLSEIIPGTPVEIDVDDEGTVGYVKATLAR